MDTFKVDRSMLNPKFEGYKLEIIDDALSRHPLEHHVTQSTVSASSEIPLSFPEMKARISHNHLSIDKESNKAFYVDTEYRIIEILFKASDLEIKVLYELPRPISRTQDDRRHGEYPSVTSYKGHTLLASDGHGLLYVLQIDQPTKQWSCLGIYTISSENVPFKVHTLVPQPDNSVMAIVSARNYESGTSSSTSTKSQKVQSPDFDVFGARVPLELATSTDKIMHLNILWQKRGSDVPLGVFYSEPHQALLLVGGSPYRLIDAAPTPSYEPSPNEIAPIPRADENLDNIPSAEKPPPPYSWTQTDDSLTVAFPLPSSISKTDIQVTFTISSLTLTIKQTNIPPLSGLAWPEYLKKAFWDTISPSSSYWTWDKEADAAFGLLTLHLDKQHESRKWMHVFASANENAEDDVPETLDPSELWKVRESLEKYTRSLQTGEDSSGLGLGTGVPKLAEGELDEEVDAEVGTQAYLTWVPLEGDQLPSSWGKPHSTPVLLLSTPMPGWEDDQPSLIVRESVDGPQFSLTSSPSGGPEWRHSYTFSALSFVIASKQDTRFVYHLSSRATLVFESGSQGRGGNLYIYRAAPRTDMWAKQAILKVGEGHSGSLLGVGMLGTTIICLFERELVLVREVQW